MSVGTSGAVGKAIGRRFRLLACPAHILDAMRFNKELADSTFGCEARHEAVDDPLQARTLSAVSIAVVSDIASLRSPLASSIFAASSSTFATIRRCSGSGGRGTVRSRNLGGLRVNLDKAAEPIDIWRACSHNGG